jgi:hypothetical protein
MDSDIKKIILSKIKIDKNTGCWNWTAALDGDGYGQIKIRKIRISPLRAHRVSYEAFVCEIPTDRQLDHLCRNRKCINPEHLELVTCKENIRRNPRIVANECRKGHKLTDENTYYSRKGNSTVRSCKICKKEKVRNNAACSSVVAQISG